MHNLFAHAIFVGFRLSIFKKCFRLFLSSDFPILQGAVMCEILKNKTINMKEQDNEKKKTERKENENSL